ncbi:hypothetical protein G647_08687 [Cladophialophora carrionii CBS 160.54]|uniref:Nephrocystin 3-like N-terminal domain-containing protein n=1 Tax=Cladophialophora carrionii CBS 160.54 TaxID=1279043 RepID=V9CYF4_9EURO|nr:uncharacterized protein G647_08687 [Cladophialophora carrionii CBS 160.54]ETI19674.1 hypothetical protein G647_08687 [Cladophialophora carrionii CBS 160.54]
MASGLEVLGAFAAASQIAEQLVRIVKSVQTIRDAPKEVVQHIASLQQLTSVVESIEANPSYQSRQVAEILSSINTKTNALSDILVRLQADPGDSNANAIKKALNSTWNTDNVANKLDQIDGDKMTLALCLARIDAQVQSEQIRNLSSQLQGLCNSNNTSAPTTEQWQDYCLAELFITNSADDRAMLTRTKGERSYGTCTWITEHPIYRSWKDPACQSPLLWISGGPGKGKTIMSVFLTEELEQLAAQSNTNMQQVLYFFCDNKDNKRNKASCVIRGLILQVLLSHPDMISHLLPDFKIQKTNLFEENSFDSLWRIFENIIREIDVASVSCVLDGIDELQDTSLGTLLAKLRDLVLPKLKVIALSRHFPRSIKDALGHYPTIRLDPDSEKEVSNDVDTYVRSNVKELSRVKRYPLELERHVFETLKLRSEGTFLWISFAVGILRKVSISETEACLDSLPAGLYDIYGRLLRGVSKANSSLVAAMLRWATLSLRPLKLEELATVLAPPSCATLTPAEVTKDRLQLCSGLLVLDGDTVTLVHQSFKDYLLRAELDGDPVLEYYKIDPDKANSEIAVKCLEFLSKERPSASVFSNALDCERLRLQRDVTFLSYATAYWPLHARASPSFGPENHSTFSFFFSQKEATGTSWFVEYMSRLGYYFDKNFLHDVFHSSNALFMVATALLISTLALKYWHRPGTFGKLILFRQHDRMLSLAFSIAVLSGNMEIARFLLSHGAHVNNAYKRDNTSIAAGTPLHLAAVHDREDVVKLLVSRSANLEAKDHNGKTPLHQAISSNRSSDFMLQLLLRAGADTAARDLQGWTPLHTACYRSDDSATRILLEAGANVNAIDKGGWTPLHVAATQFDNHLARVLIDCGANVNSRTKIGETPLHFASITASPGLLAMLLHQGADIKALDNTGKTATENLQYMFDLGLVKRFGPQHVRDSALVEVRDKLEMLQAVEEGRLPPVAACSRSMNRSSVAQYSAPPARLDEHRLHGIMTL